MRFRLNVDVRKEMKDSRLNARECLKTDYVRIRSTEFFSCKSTMAANVDLVESLLDNWLKNNHITLDKIITFAVCLYFFTNFSFQFISQPQKTGTKTKSCGISLKLDLSE